jgi:hypothetical protein
VPRRLLVSASCVCLPACIVNTLHDSMTPSMVNFRCLTAPLSLHVIHPTFSFQSSSLCCVTPTAQAPRASELGLVAHPGADQLPQGSSLVGTTRRRTSVLHWPLPAKKPWTSRCLREPFSTSVVGQLQSRFSGFVFTFLIPFALPFCLLC